MEPNPNPTKPLILMQIISIVTVTMMLGVVLFGRSLGPTTRLVLILAILGLWWVAKAWWRKTYMGQLPPDTQESLRMAERRGTRVGLWIGLIFLIVTMIFLAIRVWH